jgi:hypothetical protein
VSLIHTTRVDLGIDTTHLVAVDSRLEFPVTVDEVRHRIETLPGVGGVATLRGGSSLPLVGRAFGGAWGGPKVRRTDAVFDVTTAVEVLEYRVSSNFFDVAGLPLRLGHTWPADTTGDTPVVVIDEPLAQRLFGRDTPIGRTIATDESPLVFTVIGTVPYVYALGPEETAAPGAYFPLTHRPDGHYAQLLVRTVRPGREMRPIVEDALRPWTPVPNERFVFAVDEAVPQLTRVRRFNAALMSIFGLAGVLLGAAGVYAVMASFVAQQTREIGVRLALGATPARVQRGVLALAWRHLAWGLVIGAPAGWWLSRGFAALLFQVTPADVSVYLVVSVLIIAAGSFAAWIPARRAARIDPIVSLRR